MSIHNLLSSNNYNTWAESVTFEESASNPGNSRTFWDDTSNKPRWGALYFLTGAAPVPTPVAAETIYVRIWGSDTTGDGSFTNPYATVGFAMTTITTSSVATPFNIDVGPGQFSETNIIVKQDVMIVGQNYNSTVLTLSGSMTIGTWDATALDISGVSNCTVVGQLNMNFGVSTNGSFLCYETRFTTGPLAFIGALTNRARFVASSVNATLTSTTCQIQSNAADFTSLVLNNATSGLIATLVGGAVTTLTSTNSVATTIRLRSTPVQTLVVAGAGVTTLNVTCDSLPPIASQTLVGGTLITFLNDAYGEGYTPAVSGNWSPVPTSVQGALDQLGSVRLAGYTNISNTALGLATMTTSGTNNVLVGYQVEGALNNTGSNNTYVGSAAGFANTSGNGNSGFGRSALTSITSGANNSAFGNGALATLSTVNGNTAFGRNAGNLVTGASNTCVGDSAGGGITTGTNNAFFGANAGAVYAAGANSIGIGLNCMAGATGGSFNTCMGFSTGNALTTGSTNNTLLGRQVGVAISTGTNNTMVGNTLGGSMTSGANNVMMGKNSGTSLLTGVGNILVGDAVGTAYTGAESSNIVLGVGIAGTLGESNTTRIGSAQNACYLSGIASVATTAANEDIVSIDRTNGQLGSFNQNTFYAVRSGTVFNVPAGGAPTTIPFNTATVSNTNYATTGIYTVPTTGTYEYDCTVTYSFTETGVAGTLMDFEFFFLPSSGTSVGIQSVTASTGLGLALRVPLSSKMVISQTAGDTMRISGICGLAAPTGGGNVSILESSFSGRRIS